MIKEYICEPYKAVGKFVFGMSRDDINNISGEPMSTQNYGYPIANKILDDHGYFYILCSSDNIYEAIEFYPDYTDDDIVLIYGTKEVKLDTDIQKTVEALREVTDDLVEDEDGYASEKLGLQLYCPDEQLENAIIYARHYYD